MDSATLQRGTSDGPPFVAASGYAPFALEPSQSRDLPGSSLGSFKAGDGGASSLVLSLFPGIGLMDRGFEEAGFCVVRGPDLLWGGDIKRFHPPKGVFKGIIGGPPCQAHCKYAGVNKAIGNKVAEDLVPEFVRCVIEADPDWWLMENVPSVPTVEILGYTVQREILDNRWLGEEQSRRRVFQWGNKAGIKLSFQGFGLENPKREAACLATEGAAGRISFKRKKSVYNPRRDFGKFCELQGLPADFLSDAPFTMEAKYRVVGNGVPLAMSRATARGIKAALAGASAHERTITEHNGAQEHNVGMSHGEK